MKYMNEDDELHRVNGPAFECLNGDYSWWYKGEMHRYYGPACHYNHYNKYCIFGESVK